MSQEQMDEIEASEAEVFQKSAAAKSKAKVAKQKASAEMAATVKVYNQSVVDNVRAQTVREEKKKKAEEIRQKERGRLNTLIQKLNKYRTMFRHYNQSFQLFLEAAQNSES